MTNNGFFEPSGVKHSKVLRRQMSKKGKNSKIAEKAYELAFYAENIKKAFNINKDRGNVLAAW